MRALICGISGQDGALLAKSLIGKGYEVIGTSRDAQNSSFGNLDTLNINRQSLRLVSMAPSDFRSVLQVIKRYMPDEIYNLSGQSSVGLSFEQPVEALESIATATHNFLEVLRFLEAPIRFYNAGSSESFGEVSPLGADETTKLCPRSPYGVAKSAAYWQVANYREAYGLYACTGILFNHESSLRPARFVTRKIVSAACRIKKGSPERLRLGDLSIQRDWGYAPEYVEAMWLMLNQKGPVSDFVIATGEAYSLQDFVARVFLFLGLDWLDHVETDGELFRPSEIKFSKGNPALAKKVLGWRALTDFGGLIPKLVTAELERTR